ncbi:MAG: hypothetical protein ACP5D2_01280 [Candidatus Nanoarchaeia archaeon]
MKKVIACACLVLFFLLFLLASVSISASSSSSSMTREFYIQDGEQDGQVEQEEKPDMLVKIGSLIVILITAIYVIRKRYLRGDVVKKRHSRRTTSRHKRK